jgi:hypothetical protein
MMETETNLFDEIRLLDRKQVAEAIAGQGRAF